VGRALTLGLAEAGFDIVLTWRSSEAEAAATAEAVQRMGARCWSIQGDLEGAGEVERIIEAVRSGPGRLDLLVNSAASFDPTPLMETDSESWDRVQNVNTRAPHLLTRGCVDLLRASDQPGGGAVVNICDHMGITPWVRYGAHSVSKAALAHLTRVQALALAPGVRVNAVAPGLVLAPDGLPPERLQSEIDRAPLKRSGTPEDIVQAVLYLARAPFVTGHILMVDGGATLRG